MKKNKQDVVVLYGPPASGKTLNSIALAKKLKCTLIFEEGLLQYSTARRVLVLTNERHLLVHRDILGGSMRIEVLVIEDAKRILGKKWVNPK